MPTGNRDELANGRRQLLLTAALFSTGGVAIKTVQMTGPQVACVRSGVAGLTLLLLIPGSRRNWNRSTLLISLFYALTLTTFVLANKLTTGANAIFLQETATLYILIASPFVLKERAAVSDFVFLVPLCVGMLLFFVGSEQATSLAVNPRLGNLLAAGSGLTYACVVMGFRAVSRHGDHNASAAAVVLGNSLACAICLPFAVPFPSATPSSWLILVYLGVIQIGLAYVLMTRAMRFVPALDASLLLLLEPVLNPIWTWLAYRERPSDLALAGGVLIVAATAARAWWSGRAYNSRA